ncbi:GTPase ObgE, partial sequence, partial [Candidatus Phytoplasma solani]
IIVANKIDLKDASQKLAALQTKLPDQPIIPLSLVTFQNLEKLKYEMSSLLQKTPLTTEKSNNFKVYNLDTTKNTFTVTKEAERQFVITGNQVELFFHRTNFNNEEAVKRFDRLLKKIGIEEALRQQGAKPGDQVK